MQAVIIFLGPFRRVEERSQLSGEGRGRVLISACSRRFGKCSTLTVMTARLPFVLGGFQSA